MTSPLCLAVDTVPDGGIDPSRWTKRGIERNGYTTVRGPGRSNRARTTNSDYEKSRFKPEDVGPFGSDG